ncbi:MAG: cofactor-independent phosphoglycerate mutase [Actinomycetota bacterium]|nr:cofactor-independent phosphoglycerate mutase [Actinomycetota bacterium]
MKYCVVILDGAAGWPLPELGGRTCLGAAETPNLDELARSGRCGLAQTVPAHMEPSSSAACTSILGYDPVEDYVGRGAIEAASMGIQLAPDEVALRMNLVTVEDDRMRSYAAGHMPTEESRAIVADLGQALDDETFRVHPGVAYRHILVVKGHPELADAEYTPPHDISDREIAGNLPRGAGADMLLEYMKRARQVLQHSALNLCRTDAGELPVTDVWPFWPGVAPSGMIPFQSRRGKRAALTSGVDLLNGLAVLTGIDRLDIDGVSDGPDNDYAAQVAGAIEALGNHDVVLVHVESPDEAGHAGDIRAKIAAIEAIDREVIGRLMACGIEMRLLAMPDHPTPIALKTHVGEAVPFVLWGPGVPSNGANAYSESAAGNTGLFLDPGRGVMDLLLAQQPSRTATVL